MPQQIRPSSHGDSVPVVQSHPAAVQGGLHSASVWQVPGPPGVPVVPQQIRPVSHGDWVPVVQSHPAAVQGGAGGSSHWSSALQYPEQQPGQASPAAQVSGHASPFSGHSFG
ncbi:MAG: hypothetical protein H0T18_09535 [Chloroflexia bacterium]|nr:hypothetical protein [Chloroflexia bacterium]